MDSLPSDPSDEELAARAGRDDRFAFGELVDRYKVRLVRYLVRSCVVAESDVEDVAQVVWLKVWRALGRWKQEHFRAWLFTIARNVAADERRRQRSRPSAAPIDDGVLSLDDDDPRPDRAAEIRDETRRLGGCLEKLAVDYRAVFEGFVGGETYEQIAAKLAIPVGTVQSRLFRARNALQQCMGIEPA